MQALERAVGLKPDNALAQYRLGQLYLADEQALKAVKHLKQTSSHDCRDRLSDTDLLALDDERVMQHLQKGNTDAFAVVFKRYHRLVHVTGLHILRDAAEAEDVTQSVFLEIYRKAGQVDSAGGALKAKGS